MKQLAKHEYVAPVELLKGKIAATPLAEFFANKKGLNLWLIEMAHILAK